MPKIGEPWIPEFKPGWPEVFPTGIVVLRTLVRPERPDADDESWLDEPDEVRFIVHGARNPSPPSFGILADLSVTNPAGFAGTTVLMPLLQRDEPDELSAERADELLLQYGEWAAAALYDVAAAAIRSALGPAAIPLDVPFETPTPEIHTSKHDEDQDAQDVDDASADDGPVD